MKKSIYIQKIQKLNRIVKTLNYLRNVPWYWSLSRDKNDTNEQRREIMKEIRNAENKYKMYKARVVQYISIFNQKANCFQKIDINHYVERMF